MIERLTGGLNRFAALCVPLLFAFCGLLLLHPKKDYFKAFTSGARDGAKSALGLFPTLIAFLVAVSLFRASGLASFLADALAPYTGKIGLPGEVLPLLLTRPVSGSASTATFRDLLHTVGADSFAGFSASVMMGSTDTVLYVVTVYSASTGIGKTGRTLLYAFLTMLFGIFFSGLISRIWFIQG